MVHTKFEHLPHFTRAVLQLIRVKSIPRAPSHTGSAYNLHRAADTSTYRTRCDPADVQQYGATFKLSLLMIAAAPIGEFPQAMSNNRNTHTRRMTRGSVQFLMINIRRPQGDW